ncbi:unnamed protein product [Ceratitis capitata]|uniref:(Mediterranean fruit fly) hypothetical protein n=1 Tax=Ceratitis capitata TaxID=7213 RepID=A0A811VGP6_CERCA|nr:unnamed protein product [Ceratitis capitata]
MEVIAQVGQESYFLSVSPTIKPAATKETKSQQHALPSSKYVAKGKKGKTCEGFTNGKYFLVKMMHSNTISQNGSAQTDSQWRRVQYARAERQGQ